MRSESFVPMEQPPEINISDDIYREALLYSRIKLGTDAKFFASAKILQTLVINVLRDPTEEKY